MEKKNSQPSSSAALQAAEPSFRILYYGATGAAVPFKWESQPGTPIHALSGRASLPPLTPPPSYYSSAGASPTKPKKKKNSLTRLVKRSSGGYVSPGGSYTSSTSTSSFGESSMYYSPSPSTTESRKQRGRSVLTALINRGCGYPVSNVKNALFSVVACGRSSHPADYIV